MAAENDTKTFFKLVKSQRKLPESRQINSLLMDRYTNLEKKSARHGLLIFRNLPFRWKMKTLILNTKNWLTWIQTVLQQYVTQRATRLTQSKRMRCERLSVNSRITRLQTPLQTLWDYADPAVDTMGLCNEHLKLGGTAVVEFITSFLNCLIRSKTVTAVLKEGILTPVYKEGDPSNPGNYRGITVTPVLLKVLEHVLNRRHIKILEETQSRLQKGFTQGCSSMNAAVILTVYPGVEEH